MGQILSDVTLCTQSHLGRSKYVVLCPIPGTSKTYVEVVISSSCSVCCVHLFREKFLCRYLNIRLSDKFLSLIKFLLNVRVGPSISSISPRCGRRHDFCHPLRGTRAHALSNGVHIGVDQQARFRENPSRLFWARTQIGDFYALIDIF
jgi:hypothetical protein